MSEIKDVLQSHDLWNLINKELDKKIEGEDKARKAIFFTFNMRNVENLSKATDNLMINDEGGTGKDHVVNAVFALLPDAEKEKRVRITPKVLAYLNDTDKVPEGWIKKCLYLEDLPNSVLNDDCFKVMSSADPQGITQTSVISKGSLQNIDIKGKPSIVITIAQSNPKNELLRRFPVCNLDGGIDQTKAILKKQAKFAMKGDSPEYNNNVKRGLSLLKRIKVRIPFAEPIAEIFPKDNIIVRTSFTRFLDYIKSSCSLYQIQRKKDLDGYFVAQKEDYEHARDIMNTTTSNKMMIPLTKHQKEILKIMKQLENKGYSFQDLENIIHLPIKSRWLRNQLDSLAENGIIARFNKKEDWSNKPIVFYRYIEQDNQKLPSFEEMMNITNETDKT
jgi:DNA-binding HxlR family transcriptional regulator